MYSVAKPILRPQPIPYKGVVEYYKRTVPAADVENRKVTARFICGQHGYIDVKGQR
jgi:hypothetical protein